MSDITSGCYNGRILRVNLSDETIGTEQIEEGFCRKYLGGSGFVAYYMFKELKMGIDPLGPENKLIFASGPITGVPIPGAGRHSVGGKSPLTGGISLSEVGEFWGAELKRAGFDAVIIEGEAKRPVYLWITDGKAELKKAAHLWGRATKETQNTIRTELADHRIRVAQIGLGGENKVRYANIMHGLFNTAGRGGLGAVMGSKNLKAIAVRGHKSVSTSSPEQVKRLIKWFVDRMEDLAIPAILHKFGTGAGLEHHVNSGNIPVRNFRDGLFSEIGNIDAMTLAKTIRVDMKSCFACPVKCKKVVQFDSPYSHDPDYGGPEYETIAALGSNCGVSNLKAICKANELCNAYSLDTISTGATIAFSMECFEKGLLTKKDTGGIDLTFGNEEAMLKVIELIARREGIGDLLANGSARVSQAIGQGSDAFAIQVKGLEAGMHEPRLRWGLGLGFMINPHGADHVCNMQDPFFSDDKVMDVMKPLGFIKPHPVSSLDMEKVALFRTEHLIRTLRDCLLMCWFCVWTPLQLAEIVNAVTGWNTSIAELLRIAERVLTLSRLYNVREGFTEADDKLPKRFFGPKTDGALSNQPLDPIVMEKAKRYYYTLMGWNPVTGVPLREKVEELGLNWVLENSFNSYKLNPPA